VLNTYYYQSGAIWFKLFISLIETFRLTARRNWPRIGPYATKGGASLGRYGRPQGRKVCLRGASTVGEGAHAGLFYSKIPAIVEELS